MTWRRRGLTLVELVVVLVLLVLFGLAVGGLARTVADARDRAEALSETDQLARTILQRLSDDLAGALPLPVPLDTTAAASTFSSDLAPAVALAFYHEDTPDAAWGLERDTLRFTTAAGDPRRGDVPQGEMVEVAYFVDTDPQTPEQGLVRSVGTLPGLLPETVQPEQVPREVLSERVVALDFQFYDPDTGEWQPTWDRTDALPALVAITLGIAPLPCDAFLARVERDQRWLEQVAWFTTTVPLRVRTYPDPSVQAQTGARQPAGAPGAGAPPTGAPFPSGTPSAGTPLPGAPPTTLPPPSGQRPPGQGGMGQR